MAKLKIGQLVSDRIKKDKLGTEVFSPNYRIGIDLLDYRNGRFEGSEKCLGISGGKILTVVGRSGSGKSTLAYMIAGQILRTNEDAQIIHLDYERAANKARISKMTGVAIDKIKANSDVYNFLNSSISSESLYSLVKAIHDIKKDNASECTIETTFNGEKVTYFIPTVIIVDSVASMIPNDIIDEKELSGSMSASAIAKTNNAIYKRITNFITDANITIININHITQQIAMGPGSTKPALNFLAQGESLPGGTSAVFLSDSLLKLDPGSKLEEDKDFGIKGFTSTASFIKSRSNSSGRKFTLIFDQDKGFDNLLTNIQFLKTEGLLKGSGHGYYIETMPNKKFKMKTVRDFYAQDEEFRKGLDEYMTSIYTTFLSSQNEEEEVEEAFTLVDLLDENKGIWLGNDGLKYIYDEATGNCTLVEE